MKAYNVRTQILIEVNLDVSAEDEEDAYNVMLEVYKPILQKNQYIYNYQFNDEPEITPL